MAEGFYKELAKLLKAHGCVKVDGGKGSHEKWECPNGIKTTVPRNCKSRHTANAILKDAEIDHKI